MEFVKQLTQKYCIFDMDGTLVDAMGYWKGLGRDYLQARGFTPTQAQLDATGPMTMVESVTYFKEAFAIPDTVEDMVSDMNRQMEEHYRTDIPLKGEALALVKACKAAGKGVCVATATEEGLARACLGRLGILEHLDFLLSCEEVGRGKNFPDVYLECARRFGAPPQEIAVFEDAPYAVKTAKAAGFYTIAVPEPVYAHRWQEILAIADTSL